MNKKNYLPHFLVATMRSRFPHHLRPPIILRPRQQSNTNHSPPHHPATESFMPNSPDETCDGSCQQSIPKVLHASSSHRSCEEEIEDRLNTQHIRSSIREMRKNVQEANSKKKRAARIPLVGISCINGEGVEQGAGHGPGQARGPVFRQGIFRMSC